MLSSHKDLKRKIEAMEKKYDKQFRIVFEAITQLIEKDEKPKKKIGYLKEEQSRYGINGRNNSKIRGENSGARTSKDQSSSTQSTTEFPVKSTLRY